MTDVDDRTTHWSLPNRNRPLNTYELGPSYKLKPKHSPLYRLTCHQVNTYTLIVKYDALFALLLRD